MRSVYATYQDVRELMTVFPDGSILPLSETCEDGSLTALGFWERYLLESLVFSYFERQDCGFLDDVDLDDATYETGYFEVDEDDEGYRRFHQVDGIDEVPQGATPVTLVRFER